MTAASDVSVDDRLAILRDKIDRVTDDDLRVALEVEIVKIEALRELTSVVRTAGSTITTAVASSSPRFR